MNSVSSYNLADRNLVNMSLTSTDSKAITSSGMNSNTDNSILPISASAVTTTAEKPEPKMSKLIDAVQLNLKQLATLKEKYTRQKDESNTHVAKLYTSLDALLQMRSNIRAISAQLNCAAEFARMHEITFTDVIRIHADIDSLITKIMQMDEFHSVLSGGNYHAIIIHVLWKYCQSTKDSKTQHRLHIEILHRLNHIYTISDSNDSVDISRNWDVSTYDTTKMHSEAHLLITKVLSAFTEVTSMLNNATGSVNNLLCANTKFMTNLANNKENKPLVECADECAGGCVTPAAQITSSANDVTTLNLSTPTTLDIKLTYTYEQCAQLPTCARADALYQYIHKKLYLEDATPRFLAVDPMGGPIAIYANHSLYVSMVNSIPLSAARANEPPGNFRHMPMRTWYRELLIRGSPSAIRELCTAIVRYNHCAQFICGIARPGTEYNNGNILTYMHQGAYYVHAAGSFPHTGQLIIHHETDATRIAQLRAELETMC